MTYDGTVNSQITDAVSQTQAAVIGVGAAQSMGILDSVMAETLGMAMHNAVSNQRNMQMVSSAATTATCARILKAFGSPPAPAPSPPSPPPSPKPPPSADASAVLAQDLSTAQAAVSKFTSDASLVSAGASFAASGLQQISQQVTDAQSKLQPPNVPPPIPNPPVAPAPPTTHG